MFCQQCGNQVADTMAYCPKCGAALRKVIVVADDGLGFLIPKNSYALWSYYLGIFSMIFFPLSIVSMICGIKGITYANEHPEARGKGHAWTGIIISGMVIIVASAFISIILSETV